MPSNDVFFVDQSEQSAVKAHIVSSYFSAWSRVIQKWNTPMAYIDLFCGPGKYALTMHGFNKRDFSQWMIDDRFSILQDVRRLPEILKSKRALDVFLKENSREAKKILAVEEIIIVNNIVMCWNKPWQYGRKRVDALPSSRAFLYIDTEEIFYVCEL